MNNVYPNKDKKKERANTGSSGDEHCEKLKKGLEEQFEKALAVDLDSLEKRVLGQDFS